MTARITQPSTAADPSAHHSATSVIDRDLALLTASLLLHIMQIDRDQARAERAVSTEPSRKSP